MIIVDKKEGESIDRVLKRYKNKHRKIGVTKELRSRKHFTKPSIVKREERLKAVYTNEKFGNAGE